MRISILMPCYNDAKHLSQSLDSVLGQSGEFEIEPIVIDGGSDDGSLEILRGYGDQVRWISEPDEGQSDALNKGMKLATGEVIGWLNSDDIYEPGCLSAVSDVFRKEPNTIWLYGKVRVINESGREIRKLITRYKNRRMRRFSFQKLLTENWICQMGVFWRSEASRTVGPFRTDLHLAMDYDYWLRMGEHWPGRDLDEHLACFRWHGQSKSSRRFHQQTKEAFQIAFEASKGGYPISILKHRLNAGRLRLVYQLLRVAGY